MVGAKLNTEKYLEVLQLLLDEDIGANSNPRVGKVKLMKLLYFADFDHYFLHGASITGDTYVKLEYGPVPKHAEDMLALLYEKELLEIGEEQVYDYTRNTYRLRRRLTEIKHLGPDEVATLLSVVAKWKNHTREEIVMASHGDPPWIMADYGGEIPYELVFYREDVTGSKDEEPEPHPIRQRQQAP